MALLRHQLDDLNRHVSDDVTQPVSHQSWQHRMVVVPEQFSLMYVIILDYSSEHMAGKLQLPTA